MEVARKANIGGVFDDHKMGIQSFFVYTLVRNSLKPMRMSMCDIHSIFSFGSPAFFCS